MKKILKLLALFILFTAISKASAAAPPDLGVLAPADVVESLEDWRILDARPRELWLAGRLPGASSFSWEELTRQDGKGVKYRLLPPGKLGELLAGLGIDESSPLLVYGDLDSSWGGEGWACWVLSYLGHRGPIRLLSGGYEAWVAAGGRIEEGAGRGFEAKGGYKLDLRKELLWSLESERTDALFVDTRSFFERLGSSIEGSVSIFWKDFAAGSPPEPLSPEEYGALLGEHGIEPGKTIIFYCTGGIRSGFAWAVDRLSGRKGGAANFEGGTEALEKSK